jgi:hypothetical protein
VYSSRWRLHREEALSEGLTAQLYRQWRLRREHVGPLSVDVPIGPPSSPRRQIHETKKKRRPGLIGRPAALTPTAAAEATTTTAHRRGHHHHHKIRAAPPLEVVERSSCAGAGSAGTTPRPTTAPHHEVRGELRGDEGGSADCTSGGGGVSFYGWRERWGRT